MPAPGQAGSPPSMARETQGLGAPPGGAMGQHSPPHAPASPSASGGLSPAVRFVLYRGRFLYQILFYNLSEDTAIKRN